MIREEKRREEKREDNKGLQKRGDDTRSIPEDIYLGDLKEDKIESLFEKVTQEDKNLGIDSETGESVLMKKGPYGHYVQLGETARRKGIPKSISLNDVNLVYALQLLSLPRKVGINLKTKETVTADYGRYGPYLRCGKQNAPILGPETPLDISLDKAIELLSNKKKPKAEIRPNTSPSNVFFSELSKAIIHMPIVAIIIAIHTVSEIFSFRNKKPSSAVMKGIAAKQSKVMAAVVLVIDHIKVIIAVPSPMPPIRPDIPTLK